MTTWHGCSWRAAIHPMNSDALGRVAERKTNRTDRGSMMMDLG